jgi:hypothetical protein
VTARRATHAGNSTRLRSAFRTCGRRADRLMRSIGPDRRDGRSLSLPPPPLSLREQRIVPNIPRCTWKFRRFRGVLGLCGFRNRTGDDGFGA